MQETTLTLRPMRADDMFTMMRLLSKLGVKEIRKCFDEADISGDPESDGLNVALEIGGMLLEKLPDCRGEIYKLLSDLSGVAVEEIAKMDMVPFTNAVLDWVEAEEFRDFFTAVMKRFKREK